MILNFTDGKHDITDEWGRAFAEKFLDYIRARLVKIQEETGHMYNLEATPAESATYRFAREDKKRFVGIIQAGTSENPLLYQLFAAAGRLYRRSVRGVGAAGRSAVEIYRRHGAAPLYGAACVFGQGLPRHCQTRADQLPFTVHYHHSDFSVCPKHGYISGEHKYCPFCDEEKMAEKEEPQPHPKLHKHQHYDTIKFGEEK